MANRELPGGHHPPIRNRISQQIRRAHPAFSSKGDAAYRILQDSSHGRPEIPLQGVQQISLQLPLLQGQALPKACPELFEGCQNDRIDEWLSSQIELLLPVPYFMATVTVPQWLRSVFRSHQKIMYHLFFKASAEAIMLLALDKRFLGADIGMMGILQTWTQMLIYHPHIHFLIPGGGIFKDRWKYCKSTFFVHGKPLSRIIRAKFRDALKKEGLFEQIPKQAWKQDWVCDIKAVGNGEGVLKYLAPYVYRAAISDRNILNIDDRRVMFRYKGREGKSSNTCTLDVLAFLRRFLQHVLPNGFIKVRYFGFLATKKRKQLDHVKELIGTRLSCNSPSVPEKPKKPMTCPVSVTLLVFICLVPGYRGPP